MILSSLTVRFLTLIFFSNTVNFYFSESQRLICEEERFWETKKVTIDHDGVEQGESTQDCESGGREKQFQSSGLYTEQSNDDSHCLTNPNKRRCVTFESTSQTVHVDISSPFESSSVSSTLARLPLGVSTATTTLTTNTQTGNTSGQYYVYCFYKSPPTRNEIVGKWCVIASSTLKCSTRSRALHNQSPFSRRSSSSSSCRSTLRRVALSTHNSTTHSSLLYIFTPARLPPSPQFLRQRYSSLLSSSSSLQFISRTSSTEFASQVFFSLTHSLTLFSSFLYPTTYVHVFQLHT